jgi:protein involved in polysaccharide export with SLBB domain
MHIQNRQRTFWTDIFCRQFLRKLKQSGIGCVFATFVLLSCGGCETSSKTPLPDQPIATTPVTLSPGDVIKLTFPGATDLNQSQKIRADGKVSLPLVGEVTAAGKMLMDFQNELTALYKPQLRNSDVIVSLEKGEATVVVSGYVNKPGKFTFDRPTTVFQAIMEAGGVNEYGSLSNVHLVRIINGEQHTQVLNIRDAMSGKTTKVNYVKDGDVVYVKHSLF